MTDLERLKLYFKQLEDKHRWHTSGFRIEVLQGWFAIAKKNKHMTLEAFLAVALYNYHHPYFDGRTITEIANEFRQTDPLATKDELFMSLFETNLENHAVWPIDYVLEIGDRIQPVWCVDQASERAGRHALYQGRQFFLPPEVFAAGPVYLLERGKRMFRLEPTRTWRADGKGGWFLTEGPLTAEEKVWCAVGKKPRSPYRHNDPIEYIGLAPGDPPKV